MRIDAKLVFLIILPCSAGTTLTQAAGQLLSLSISAEQSARIGSEVKVKTNLTNITNHVLYLSDSNRDCDYSTEVRDDKGNPAPETTYKHQLRCNQGLSDGRVKTVSLKPHESKQDEVVLNRLYDLRPGRYEVQVERVIPKELGQGSVISNTLTITVTE
jgi:hypothetical protein